jgi:hypothetical protein
MRSAALSPGGFTARHGDRTNRLRGHDPLHWRISLSLTEFKIVGMFTISGTALASDLDR